MARLKIGDNAPEVIGDLGFSGASLTCDRQGVETLTLTGPFLLDGAAPIASFQKCVLLDDEGATRFVGWLDLPPRRAQGGAESRDFILTGPHRWLARRTMMVRNQGIVTLGAEVDSGGEPEDRAALRAVSSVLLDILTFARLESDEEFDFVAEDLNDDIFHVQITPERRVDNSCWQAIVAMLQYVPTVSVWWEYTGAKPKIRFRDLSESPDHVVSEELMPITTLEATPRIDLLRDVVTVIWREGEVEKGRNATASAGDAAALAADCTHVVTFEHGARYNLPTAGLAQRLAKWWQKLHIDTTVATDDIDWSLLPGQLWGFGGVLAEWSGYSSVCYSITRDLFLETESKMIGVPPAFGIVKISDRVAQANSTVPAAEQGSENPPDEDPTGEMEIVINGIAGHVDKATWSVGDQGGSGDGSVDLPPGTYNVIFNPVYFEGRFFFASAVSGIEIEDGGNATATAEYEEGFVGGKQPLQLVREDDSSFRVMPSTAAGEVIGDQVYSSGGSGYIYAVINWSTSTGEVDSVELNDYSGTQESSDGTTYVLVGRWESDGETVTLTNYRYGPILTQPCRDWEGEEAKWQLYIVG